MLATLPLSSTLPVVGAVRRERTADCRFGMARSGGHPDCGLGRASGKGLNRGERGGRGEGLEDSGLGRATGKGLNRGETQWVSGEREGRGEDRSDWGSGS